MRTLIALTIAAVGAFTVWSTNVTAAKQITAVSVEPLSMMTNSTNLPIEQFDLL